MGSSPSVMRPQELMEFRKLNTSIENVEIPARPENRTVTDKKGFILFGVGIIILIPFLIYTLANADIRHLFHGTDNCGDFCGYNNEKISGIACSGKDLREFPYSLGNTCVKECPNGHFQGICVVKTDFSKDFNHSFTRNRDPFDPYSNTRFNKRDVDDFDSKDFDELFTKKENPVLFGIRQSGRDWWKYLLTIIVTIAVGIMTLVLLRFVPAPFVWGIVIFSMFILTIITIGLWYLYFDFRSYDEVEMRQTAGVFLPVAVVWTIIAVIVLIVFIVLFKKIGLVVQLYREATKVLAAMPMLVFVPILFTFIQILVLAIAAIVTAYLFCARGLTKYGENFYRYEPSGVFTFTIIYNLIITAWAMRLIAGVQFMIISGSASTWYFSKNKDYLDSPICNNFKIVFKFHIGTIAFGSFLLTLFAVVKFILRAICRNACCRCLTVMCCSSVEIILKFLSENSYIQTGIHGQSYIRSAKRATKLLINNATSVIAINCVGDFVLGIIILVMSVLTTAISFALFMNMGSRAAMLPTFICLVVNIIIISIIFASFSTIIDTLFICFCEDSVINDGMSRPYFMSRGLMEFVENSKKVYGK